MKFLGLFIFFVALTAYFRRKNTRDQNTAEENFWNIERAANHARRQDISGLPYVTIPLENFTMNICDNRELKDCEQTLKELSTKKILNLNNETNTELKLKYGPANLDALTEYDQNYVTLCLTLVAYAKCLIDLGYKKEAQTVLEFGLSCGSDLSKNYLLLADLYLEAGNKAGFNELTERAKALDSPLKTSILKQLADRSEHI